jgi:peptide/nickel transport system permease protein
MYNALKFRDFPMIQGGVIVTGALVIVANLTVDTLYAFIDPRIRYGRGRVK